MGLAIDKIKNYFVFVSILRYGSKYWTISTRMKRRQEKDEKCGPTVKNA